MSQLPRPLEPPALLVLTDRLAIPPAGDTAERSLVRLVEQLAGFEDTAVVFREKDLAAGPRAELAHDVAEAAAVAGLPLIVASDAALARRVGAVGVHLAASDPWPMATGRRPVGRSCHDQASVVAAVGEGAAWVTVSPVFPTPTKPGYGPPLGVDGLAAVVRICPVPVYALGGVTSGRAAGCVAAGAHGVAVLGAVMGADDPAAVVADLLAELHQARPAREEPPA